MEHDILLRVVFEQIMFDEGAVASVVLKAPFDGQPVSERDDAILASVLSHLISKT